MDTETTWHGEYGPYRQSMRREIYQAYAKYLLEQGKAYPCFATAEELEEMRKLKRLLVLNLDIMEFGLSIEI